LNPIDHLRGLVVVRFSTSSKLMPRYKSFDIVVGRS
jgi:hypothetical protein